MSKLNFIKNNLLCSHLFVFTILLLVKTLIIDALIFENIFHLILLEFSFIVVFTFLIEIIFKKGKRYAYLFLNIIFTSILVAAYIYYTYYDSVFTYHVFDYINQLSGVSGSVQSLLNPLYLLFYVDVLFMIILMIIKKYPFQDIKKLKRIPALLFLVFFVGVSLTVTSNAVKEDIHNYNLLAHNIGIFNYSALQVYSVFNSPDKYNEISSELIKSIQNKSKNEDSNITDSNEESLEEVTEGNIEIKEVYQEDKISPKYFGIAKDKNIIAIQLESFQNYVLNLEVNGEEVTPNLNKFIENSLYFPNVFQQIGQGNTSDAEFIANTSLLPLQMGAMSKVHGDKVFPSIPRILKEEGYFSSTFHANDVTFWYRDSLYPALGFDKYYDISFFGKEDIIGMGPSDKVLYRKSVEELSKLNENNQKFYAQLITLSNHHPYTLPDKEKYLTLPKEFQNTIVGDYLQSIRYADEAFGYLLELLEEYNMKEDTIILLYGDHFGLLPNQLGEKENKLMEELLGTTYEYPHAFNIPFIIHAPNQLEGEVIDNVGGQVDILPTLLNLLGVETDNVLFGQDLINSPNDNLIIERFYLPYGSFINEEVMFYAGKKGYSDAEIFDIHTKKKIDLTDKYKDDYEKAIELMKISDAYINGLPKR